MKCKHVRKELSAYLDDEITARRRVGIEQHLAKCPECERYKKELSLVTESLRRLGRIEPSASFYADTMRRIRAATKVPAARRVFARRLAVALVSCIAVVMFILGWLVLSVNRSELGPSDISLADVVVATLLGDEATDDEPYETGVAASLGELVSSELPLLLATSYTGEPDLDGIPIEEMIETLSDSEKAEFREALLSLVQEGQNNAG